MLDVLNGYGHGFVAIPTILACRETGVLAALARNPGADAGAISQQVTGNSGYVAAALRLLHSLGWLDRDTDGGYRWTSQPARCDRVSTEFWQWLDFPIDDVLAGKSDAGQLECWAEWVSQRWGVDDAEIASLLDGYFAVPLLNSLRKIGWLNVTTGDAPGFLQPASEPLANSLRSIYRSLQWADGDDLRLTDLGAFVSQRALILGTLCSYQPMLRQFSKLLVGDPSEVFGRDNLGHEQHVERTLNVQASGFQHEKYFTDVADVIASIFSGDVASQPNYVADMGCGDGSLLKRVYEVISDQSSRGRLLGQHPVRMVGADFNQKALDATSRTLSEIPHLVTKGDIGDPQQLVSSLTELGISDRDSVLHIRSFLDHDRPLIAPSDQRAIERRRRIDYQGVYIDPSGQSIEPAYVVQSLVEHLERWRAIATSHGILLLEVHSLPPSVSHRYSGQSESLHFDAYHAFSKQYLVDADVFLMAAAEAGLFPDTDFFRRYPKTLPFCRITLGWYQPRDYTVRHAHPDDLNQIEALQPASEASSFDVIGRRVEECPLSTFVLERSDGIAAALTCQRSTDAQSKSADPNIDRLDGVFSHSDLNPQVLDEFKRFVAIVCEVRSSVEPLVEANETSSSGAAQGLARSETDGEKSAVDVKSFVESTVQRLMEENGEVYDASKTFYELGLDSLDHMELATLLQNGLPGDFDSNLLLKHDSPAALISHLEKREKKKSGSLFSMFKRSAN